MGSIEFRLRNSRLSLIRSKARIKGGERDTVKQGSNQSIDRELRS